MENDLKIEVFKKYLENWNEDKYINDIHLTSDGSIEYHKLEYEIWDTDDIADKAKELIDFVIDDLTALIDHHIPLTYKDYIKVDEDKIQEEFDIFSDTDIIEQSGYSVVESIYLNGNDYYIVEKG